MDREYITKHRMVTYYNQVRIIKSLGKSVTNILEIGILNSIFAHLMSPNGYQVTTADINPDLKPDILLNLMTDFELPKDTFDVIVAFQVLEHIPYDFFEKVLIKFSEASKKYVVISLPYQSIFMTLQFHASFAWTPKYLKLEIPKFWHSTPLSEEHYWEIGLKGYPKKRILKSIETTGLKLKRQFQDPYYPYHYFFVLEK
ncbi:class I SAM-dependent methyltransferase [Oxynema aestuarii]|uniref:Class I SAM-dependent methyltransferase n=1 Tax=Oxynema aestuarii AP17 TaxID=2064643 RepID=A0A6H1U2A1_9CYAN|nr:methyltransferase domain-containing protein [Oxynema aestuarii]QIZ72964.1 class I SAM-dependent methyltransferase [Oxynema aestuarii AP17]